MEIYNGRPEDNTGRLDKELRVYDLLDSLEIPFIRVDHEEANTMESCKEISDLFQCMICKNLFLTNRQKTAFYLLLMPEGKVFKTKELSSQINSARLSFAGPEEMEKYLDITPGSVSITGLMNDHENHVKLLVDEEVLQSEYFGCHPSKNTSSIKLKTKDVFEKLLPAMHHDMTVVKLLGMD